jgi:predicted enzyme related to lactoylglutathione lyase
MANRVVHFEVGAADDQVLVEFYGELFGWRMRAVPGGRYTLVDTRGGGGVNGWIGRSQTGEAWASCNVEVDDPQAGLDRVGSLGGRTAWPVTELPGRPAFAMFDDPDGLLVGLVRRQEGRDAGSLGPSEGIGAGGEARWATVYASVADVERALARAEALGGTRVYGPLDVDGHMLTAGSVFGVYQHGSP